MSISISNLYFYPIKSCAGVETSVAPLLDRGLRYDREWMVVEASNGRQLTQREVPSLALVKVTVHDRGLLLHAPSMPELVVPVVASAEPLEVRVWDDVCLAIDQGDSVADWLSSYCGRRCRLVRMQDGFNRRVDPARLPDRVFITGFADQFPLLLISRASLDALNNELEIPVHINRFRPNIVVDGCEPFEEDQWSRIEINGIVLRLVKPCARCSVVSVDQEDASISKEPLRTLAAFRKVDGKTLFGQNLAHERNGTLNVGDVVTVLSRR